MLNQHQSLQNPKPRQTIILLVGVLALVCIGVFHTFPPMPSLLSASSASFSSARAMTHVRQIGLHPHPTGSLENAQVRQYLVGQLKELGLEPEIQSALMVNPQKKHAGRIHNVLVRVLGKKPSKALLLAAHYDSVHTGPGAADDGASVAAILETLRAIKTQPTLQNDLICIFTDSEETGLLGAEAFVRQHPWAKTIGLALNFEYRGNRGAFIMFETSQGNGKLIEGLATATPLVLANSMMYEVYKRLPNDTDLTMFKQAGIPGMNFAAIEGHTSYHTQLDRPELLDQGSLQNEGDIMLTLVKHFGSIPLTDLAFSDRVYFDVAGLGLVNYPVSWVMPLNAMLLLLFATVITLGLRTKTVRPGRVVLGAIAFLTILIGLAATSYFLWLGILQLHPEYDSFFQGDTYNSHWYLRAFVFLNIGLFGFLQAYVCRWLRPIEFTLGVIAYWLILLLASSVWFPGVSFLFFWPLVAMLAVMGLLFILRNKNAQLPVDESLTRKFLKATLIFLGSIPGILLLTPIIRVLFIGLTPQMVGVVIAFLILLLGLLTPLLEMMGQQKWVIRSSLLLGFAALATGSLTSGFDAGHPRQNTLFYALNSSGQRAFWLSTDNQLDQWTSAFFPKTQAKQQVSSIFGESFSEMWVATAPVLGLQKPTIEILGDNAISDKSSDKRRINIRVKSTRQAPKLKVTIEGIDVLQSKVGGQLYSQSPQHHWSLDSVGLNEEYLIIEFMVNAGVPFVIRAIDFSFGLPAIIQNHRPSSMISKPSEFSDTTAVVNVVDYR
jgi:Peptidase family M28